MKKIALILLALVGMFSTARAATPTPTPNLTATAAQTQIQQTQTAVAATATYVQTAFPTLTPTLTPTGTITPSATFTPSPKQLKNDFRKRLYFIPSDFTQADGITVIGASALPGSASSWMVQDLSQSAAVLSTGAAEVRLGFTIPWDYKGKANLFLIMNCQTIGDSVTLTASVNGQSFNCTTQTVGTFNYTPPRGGRYYIAGTATQVVAGYGGQILDPLWNTPLQVVSRVMMPLNPQATAYWNTLPSLYPVIRRGDIVNFDIKRTTAGSGNIYVYGAEFQYDYAQDMQP